MKRLLAFISALILSSSLTTMTWAYTQDHSFTYLSTAGMFEDMYDFFKYSPAYLPSFQKSSLWTELSNLQDTYDEIFNDGSPANYYMIGGQTDLMGMGRIGAMLDWYSYSNPVQGYDFLGNTVSGFSDDTVVTNEDLDMDGQYDQRTVNYARIDKSEHNFDNDIYVAYGIGDMFGFDLGAALRVDWQSYKPTYNPGYYNSSFDEVQRRTQVDLNTDTLLYKYERTKTGSLDYGDSNLKLILGARSKLMPELDCVVNAGPILHMETNKYDYEDSAMEDTNPADSNNYRKDNYKEEGMEPYAGFYPGSGLGFLLNVRGDYALNKNVMIIATAGYEVTPLTISGDAKLERTTDDDSAEWVGADLIRNQYKVNDNDTYEGNSYNNELSAGVRLQYTADVWRLGLGVNASTAKDSLEVTTKNQYKSEYIHSGEPVPANNYTSITTWDSETDLESYTVTDQLEFPVGLIINVVQNLPIRFGVKHVVRVIETTIKSEVTSQGPSNVINRYGDGSTYQYLNPQTYTPGGESSTVTLRQYDEFVYGISWWPSPTLQIDVTGFGDWIDGLEYYRLSFNFYF